MVEIEIAPSCVTKVPPLLVAQAKVELERVLENKKWRARKKSLEIIEVAGHWLQVGCHKINDVVRITKMSQMRGKRGYTPQRKRRGRGY